MGTTIVGKMSSSNNANRKSRNTKTNNNSKLLVLVNSVAVVTALFSTYYFMFEPVTLKPYPQEENPFDKLGLARTNNNNNTAANATAIPEEALGVLPFDDYYDDDSDADDQAFVDSYEYDEEDDDGFLSGGNETRTLASFWGSFRFSGRRNHATTTSSLRKIAAKVPP